MLDLPHQQHKSAKPGIRHGAYYQLAEEERCVENSFQLLHYSSRSTALQASSKLTGTSLYMRMCLLMTPKYFQQVLQVLALSMSARALSKASRKRRR